MKITRSQLRKLIKEESYPDLGMLGFDDGAPNQAEEIYELLSKSMPEKYLHLQGSVIVVYENEKDFNDGNPDFVIHVKMP